MYIYGMDIRKLMIDNIVLSDGALVEVETICAYNGVETTANNEGSCNGKIEFMQLTKSFLDEILKYDEDNENYPFEIDRQWVIPYSHISAEDDHFILTSADGLHVVLKYVHQVQNIITALKSE